MDRTGRREPDVRCPNSIWLSLVVWVRVGRSRKGVECGRDARITKIPCRASGDDSDDANGLEAHVPGFLPCPDPH